MIEQKCGELSAFIAKQKEINYLYYINKSARRIPLHTKLNDEIIKTVAYFDIFEYPLTAEQIHTFLPRSADSPSVVIECADRLVSEGALSKADGYYFLPSVKENYVAQRLSGELRAKKLISVARTVSSFIKLVPFTRAVFITGSLSKNIADDSSDIDFMIVTARDRLWICKTILTVFRKLFLFGNSKYFCTNYYVTENGYSQHHRNLYTAIEVVTTKVLWNEPAFKQFQAENKWTGEFLPNASIHPQQNLLISHSRSWLQKGLENGMRLLPLGWLNRKLMEIHKEHWEGIFQSAGRENQNALFIITPDISSCWPNDRQKPILSQFLQKLSFLGLQ
ncbi:MAG: hypothetical protein WCW35_06770 [Bacteroidota bacterium]